MTNHLSYVSNDPNGGPEGHQHLDPALHIAGNDEGFGAVKGNLSSVRMGMIWLAANLVVTTLLTGTLFVPGVSWLQAIGLIIIGTAIGGAVLILVGNMGTRTGLATMSLTKGAFGLRGAYLPTIANVVVLIGWCCVQAMLAGVTVNYLAEQFFGFSNPVLFSAVCQTIVVGLAIFGHEGIAKIEPWLALIILSLMAYIVSITFDTYTVSEFVSLPVDIEAGWSALIVLDIVVATAISWTVLSADFNRFAKSQAAGMIGSGTGYFLSTVLAMSLGATAISYLALNGDTPQAFDPTVIVAAFGLPVAIVVFLSVMASNTMGMYGMVSSTINMVPSSKIKFLPTALILGAISIAGSTWLAMLERFTTFLTFVGAIFIPVFAIMLVDYYIVKKGFYNADILRSHGGEYWYKNGVNIAALVVWGMGVATSVLLTYFFVSPIGATLPVFFISAFLYVCWALLAKKIVPGTPVSVHLGSIDNDNA